MLTTVFPVTETCLTSGSPQPPKIRIPLPPASPGPLYWFALTVLPRICAEAPRAISMPFGAIILPNALVGPVAVTVLSLTRADDPGTSTSMPSFW